MLVSAVLPGLAEQVVEVESARRRRRCIPATTAAAAAETTSEAAAGEHPAGLVVLFALGLVGQHIRASPTSFVPLLSGRIVRVAVGVVLGEQLFWRPV